MKAARYNMFVIKVSGNSNDAPRLVADIDELHDEISPKDLVIDRILVREHTLGQALANDHDHLSAASIIVIRATAAQHWLLIAESRVAPSCVS